MIRDMNGVYLLINNKEIVYVGETTRDLERIQEHKRKAKIPFDNYIMFHFREASWARQFEMAIICHCYPEYNRDKPNQCFLKIGEIKRFCGKIIGYQISGHTYQNKKVIKRMNTKNKHKPSPSFPARKKSNRKDKSPQKSR